MRKPIFESEEELAEFLKNTIIEVYNGIPAPSSGYDVNKTLLRTIARAKENGYVKKTIVEEAEEAYSEWVGKTNHDEAAMSIDVILKQHGAIAYLKKQLEAK